MMNNNPIKGQPIKIMWSKPESSGTASQSSEVGKIIVKNFDESVTDQCLDDTFSEFGTILSCEVIFSD